MKNLTSVKVPKQYLEGIEEIEKASAEDRGYWLYTKEGYYISHEDFGVMIGRYDTQKELMVAVRSVKKEEQEVKETTFNKEMVISGLNGSIRIKTTLRNRLIRELESQESRGVATKAHIEKTTKSITQYHNQIEEIEAQIKFIENM